MENSFMHVAPVIRKIFSRKNVSHVSERYGTRISMVFVWYGVIWSILGDDAFPKEFVRSKHDSAVANTTDDALVCELNSSEAMNICNVSSNLMEIRGLLDIPDGHFFALFILFVFSALFGFLVRLVYLHPLTGMLIAGFILRNVPYIDFAADINPMWSSTIRNICLVVVLIRGGLSLNSRQLKRLKLAVFLLAILPCVCEGAVDGVVATFLLPLPWKWGLMLGYILAAISPAVVIPTLLQLQHRQYGVSKGIPTLIIAAASVDVVTAVSLFGIFLGLVFSEGNLVLDIFRAPIQITLGLAFGVIFGVLLWILPSRKNLESQLRNRFFLLLGFGLFGLFGSRRAVIGGSNLAGAGALAVLVLSFIAGHGWNDTEKQLVNRAFFIVWKFLEPLLFGLIGAEVDTNFITASLIGQGVVVIFSGLICRVVISMVVVSGNGFNLKERIVIAAAWIPKATVQAAIGSFALDIAVDNNVGQHAEDLARKVLTISVLSIVLTAPVGAAAIGILGPRLLEKSTHKDEDITLEGEHPTVNGLCSQDCKKYKETTV